jgi:hypothetical protein
MHPGEDVRYIWDISMVVSSEQCSIGVCDTVAPIDVPGRMGGLYATVRGGVK